MMQLIIIYVVIVPSVPQFLSMVPVVYPFPYMDQTNRTCVNLLYDLMSLFTI